MWDALEMGQRSEDPAGRSRDNGDEELQTALDRLSQDAFELGLYDRNERPEGANDE